MSVARAVIAALVCAPGAASASEAAEIAMAPGGDAEVAAGVERPLALGAVHLAAGVRADAFLVRLDGLGDHEPVAILRPALSASASWRPAPWLALDAQIAIGRDAPRVMRECDIAVSGNHGAARLRFRDTADRVDLTLERAIGGTTIGLQIENLFDVAPRDVAELKPDPPRQALLMLGRAI